MNPFKTFEQETPGDSPWSIRQRMAMLIWDFAWALLCVWTPKPANGWRLAVLRLFGVTVTGVPFVHQRARIQIPWRVTLHDRATLGDRANLYSLGDIEIGAHAVIAQEAYLSTGTHAFGQPAQNLVTAKITIGDHAFVGARAFIMPGVVIGKHAIVGACSVVTRDVADGDTVVGNPAKLLAPKERDAVDAVAAESAA